ncbi:MAG: hypothetical protein ABIH76_05910 [Candidatus Bathyarchaeota archaeon]
MRIHESDIRPIPRQAINGFMSLGILLDERRYFCIQLEPQVGSAQPFIRIVEFLKMKRSDDILDGDTEPASKEISEAVLKFAVDTGLLSEKRVEISIRKAAATSKNLQPPQFIHKYRCLMYQEKLEDWDGKSKKPQPLVTTIDCWACKQKYRKPCIGKLTIYEEETGPNRFIGDLPENK